jgi:hypothetical protein
VPGRADGTCGKGKGVVNAATAASALSSTQDNTVRVADVLQRLAVQGTVHPVGGQGTAEHWTAAVALVVSAGLDMPDVHGRPAARDIKAAGNCDHAQVRVVTASDVHFSRSQTIGLIPRFAGVARRRKRRLCSFPTVSLLSFRADGGAPRQESTPHPPRNFSFSVLKLTDRDNLRGLNQAPSPN